jgi:hypothetical protein
MGWRHHKEDRKIGKGKMEKKKKRGKNIRIERGCPLPPVLLNQPIMSLVGGSWGHRDQY